MLAVKLLRLHRRLDDEILYRRIAIFFAMPVIIYFAFDNLFFTDIQKRINTVNVELSEKQSQISTVKSQMNVDKLKIERSKSDRRLEQRNYLVQSINDIDKKLGARTSSEVSPKEMSLMLREMLSYDNKVKLLSLKNLPPEQLRIDLAMNSDQSANKSSSSLFYRHGIEVVVSGGYFDIVNYLQAVESMKWQLFWDKLSYSVSKYPLATVQFTIYSLSRQENWIGN